MISSETVCELRVCGCVCACVCACVPVQSPAPWAGPPSFTCLTKMVSIGSRRFLCLPGNERESTCTEAIGHTVRKQQQQQQKQKQN